MTAAGRPRLFSGSEVEAIKARVEGGESKSDLAAEFGVSRATLYRYLNPGQRLSSEEGRRAALRNKYKLDSEGFTQLLERQGGRCLICEKASERLFVDHRHDCCAAGTAGCGECVRGLLCNKCNAGLGYFKDDAVALRRAAEYLERLAVTG
jgi:hypothetical protein